MDPLKHEMCVHSDYQRPTISRPFVARIIHPGPGYLYVTQLAYPSEVKLYFQLFAKDCIEKKSLRLEKGFLFFQKGRGLIKWEFLSPENSFWCRKSHNNFLLKWDRTGS